MREIGKYNLSLLKASEIDLEGFSKRLQEIEIRDCFFLPQTSSKVVFGLLYKSKSEGTVLETFLIANQGVLNLDFGRTTVGRYPTNFIITHGPHCTFKGLKRVKTNGAVSCVVKEQADGRIQFNQKKPGYRKISHTDEDGTEEILDWECQSECPIKILDDQSGAMGPSARPNSEHKQWEYSRIGIFDQLNSQISPGYEDFGGASRYFKQVESYEELTNYLTILIRNDYKF